MTSDINKEGDAKYIAGGIGWLGILILIPVITIFSFAGSAEEQKKLRDEKRAEKEAELWKYINGDLDTVNINGETLGPPVKPTPTPTRPSYLCRDGQVMLGGKCTVLDER